MNEYSVPKEELIAHLHSDAESGLASGQAKLNAAEHGANTLTKVKPESLLMRIRRAATEPMILMLTAAGIIALAVNSIQAATGGEANYLECAGIFTAISLSVVITVVMEGKSAKAFEALSRINGNVPVKVLRDGAPLMLSHEDIVVGDILLLAAGDKIPADGRLVQSMGLAADESTLTGESTPARKDADHIPACEKTPLAERSNMLYSGTYIISGFCRLLVTAVGDKTEFGKIARELSIIDKSTTPLQEKLGRLGRTITLFGVTAASVVFIAQLISFARNGGLVLKEVMDAIVTSVVLIVAAVPEGLPTIVVVSLSINIIKLSKKNALVKKMIASETVGCVNVICSDKTGTLTENRMTVLGGVNNELILRNICVNSTADIGADGAFIGNPTECALLVAAEKAGWNYRQYRRSAALTNVFPFSSEEKDMTTVVKVADGCIAYTKGSPEKIFGSSCLAAPKRAEIEAQITEYQRKACRVIAFAHRTLNGCSEACDCPATDESAVECGMGYDGFVAISDPLRRGVYEAVERCRTAGVTLKILTGDNVITAKAIADELHLFDGGGVAVEARELEQLSDEELSRRLPSISVIARSTPTTKMRVVKLLEAMGNVVAVTGDGINDAPALRNADVGIAMGILGAEVSKEASDIVLLDDSFSTIVDAIEWGRGIYENFRRFICFQLIVNVSSVIVVLSSILLGLKAPFTALQLLWINIIMDGPPALTLGLEPVSGDLMELAPVRRSDNIISGELLGKIGATGLYISAVFLAQYSFNFLGAADGQAPTVLFTLFTMFQIFNAFNCRELHSGSIFKNLTKNRLMLSVVGATFVLQILIIQFAGAFFGTVPLPLAMWLKLFAAAASVIVLSELVKLVWRKTKTALRP